MDEATTIYLDRIRDDLEPLLGGGATRVRISTADDAGTTILRLAFRLSGIDWASEARGASLVEAHARLRRQVVEDRLGIGFRVLAGE